MRWIGGLLMGVVVSGTCLAADRTLVVAGDGSGDFKTVQEEIAAAPAGGSGRTVIRIKAGRYARPFVVPKEKGWLTLLGEDAKRTILTWDRNVNDPKPAGADGFNPGMLVRADDFQAAHLTIENTSGDHGQALALRVEGDREVFVDCRLIGWQDTLLVNGGRDYFQDCYLAGRVDFIYGSATAWFQGCEIHSRNGGHITAASTPEEQAFGFMFADCRLTGDAEAWDPATTNPATTQKARVTPVADLGRPWRPYGSVTYLRCEMGSHILPAGWNNWGKASNEQTARYAEYRSSGPGGSSEKRVAWARQLTEEQAKGITVKAVVGGKEGWDPVAEARGLLAAKEPAR